MTTANLYEAVRAYRSAVGFITVYIGRRPCFNRQVFFRPLPVSITVILWVLFSLLLPSRSAYGQSSSVDEQGVRRSSTSRRGSTHRVQSSRKAHRLAKEKAKRDQYEKAPGGLEGEVDSSTDKSGGQAVGSDRTDKVKAEFDESFDLGDVNKQGDRSVPTNRKPDNAGGLARGGKTIEQTNAGAAAQYSRRMEFDARLVYGETAGSGAVILFERGQRQLPPLTEQRTRFLSATTEPVFGKKYEPPFRPRDTWKGVEVDKSDNRSVIDGSRN